MDQDSSFPSEFQRRTLWRALTGIAIVILGALLVGLIWLASSVLGYLQPVLVPLAVAGIVAYLLEPVVRFLQRKGISRIKGIIAVFCSFILFIGVLLAFVGKELSKPEKPVATSEEDQKPSENKPNAFREMLTADSVSNIKKHPVLGWAAKIAFEKNFDATNTHLHKGDALIGNNGKRWYLDPATDTFKSGGQQAPPELAELLRSDWSTPTTVGTTDNAESVVAVANFPLTQIGNRYTILLDRTFGWLLSSSGKILGFFGMFIGFAMVPIYLYYFLKESDSIQSQWHDYIPLKASKFKDEVVSVLQEINGYLISFFRGQVLVAFIDGILVGIALSIFGLKYGLLIGVFMALLGIIPYLGNIICLIPACIIAYFQASSNNPPWDLPPWGFVIGVVAIFVVVQQINSLLTAPKIVGDSVGLHPMTVIFSMLFWSLILGGFLGALLAVPLTAAVKVIFRRYLWDRKIEMPPPAAKSPA
ncbi:MAG: AI-2E family transporter [Verrucomicrobiaceae bacterium]